MKSFFSWYSLGLLLIASMSGCRMTEQITRASQLDDPSKTGTLKVLTKDSVLYVFDNYRLRDSTLLGSGYTASELISQPFTGRINLNKIAYIEANRSNFFGTVIGAGIAVFFVGTVAMYARDMGGAFSVAENTRTVSVYTGPTGGGGGSCPHVYSLDGSATHLESETFAGAVFKGAERTAYDVLNWANPEDNVLKLKITNENKETEYTNEMKILAVDAPLDATVIPDHQGAIHTISEKISPKSCVDYDGSSRKDEILNCDGRLWQSELDKKDFSKPSDLHDGLILTFPKPEGAKLAKLMVTGTNTKLAIYAFEHIFKLRGENKLRWYQQLETNPSERMKFIKFMLREGMLHVKVWQQDRWMEKDAIADIGPLVVKPQLAVLDVSQIPGNELKIKLDATTDLWRIDEVYIDYTKDEEVTVQSIPPFKAVTESGTDVTDRLISNDNSYYTMLLGQYAIVSFHVPPTDVSSRRTYVLKTRGYYHQWFESHGEDHPEEVERILSEPSYGSAKYLPMWKLNKDTYQ